jgi:hypothetical protein
MSILSNIFSTGASSLVSSIGEAFDKNFTSDKERLDAKEKLIEQANELVTNLQEAQKQVLLSETSGNWLQRSWRPIIMLSFGFIVVYTYFIQPAFLPQAVKVSDILPEKFWTLLEIGFGGYIIGRSAEKTASSVATIINKKS